MNTESPNIEGVQIPPATPKTAQNLWVVVSSSGTPIKAMVVQADRFEDANRVALGLWQDQAATGVWNYPTACLAKPLNDWVSEMANLQAAVGTFYAYERSLNDRLRTLEDTMHEGIGLKSRMLFMESANVSLEAHFLELKDQIAALTPPGQNDLTESVKVINGRWAAIQNEQADLKKQIEELKKKLADLGSLY